jgi:F0F1-type ATP synthase epsilon subunit
VNVIAEIAELADDIDLDRAKAALAAAQAAGAENEAAAIRRAETRINIASVAKGLR